MLQTKKEGLHKYWSLLEMKLLPLWQFILKTMIMINEAWKLDLKIVLLGSFERPIFFSQYHELDDSNRQKYQRFFETNSQNLSLETRSYCGGTLKSTLWDQFSCLLKSSNSSICIRHCILGYYCVIIGLSKKRKQHLSQISARAGESHKHRKIDQENKRKKRFLRK